MRVDLPVKQRVTNQDTVQCNSRAPRAESNSPSFFLTIMAELARAELARWCDEQGFSGRMTDAVIKAFGDLDSLRSCAKHLDFVNEGLEGLPPVPRKKVVAAIRALAEPGAAPASESA